MAKKTAHRPRRTIKLVPESGQDCAWCSGTIGGKPAMHVVCHCQATNVIDNPIYLLKAFINRPFVEGDIAVKHLQLNVYGTYPIFPEKTTQVAIHFFIQPPRCKSGKDFKTSVTIIDMYGNKHKTGIIKFSELKTVVKSEKAEKGESITAIQNPIEKKVAEVLKAELHRFENCGQKEGGLGSVITQYKNRVILGVGSDLRALCSFENHPIIRDPHNATIESDNADSLLGLYNNLQNQKDQAKFKNALLKRLGGYREYKSVGYFIVFVLSRIGQITPALKAAKSNLRGDRGNAFNNVLMLLDGLLKYNHHILTEKQIGEIEKIVSDIDEHAFRIRERLAALRQLRLICDNCSLIRQSLACIAFSAWSDCLAGRWSPKGSTAAALYH